MEPFRTLESRTVVLMQDNIDTDQIIPARFLKKPRDKGFASYLFHDLRADPKFILNHPGYRGAEVVVAARNFACGSSREHAVWALCDYGIRAVISSAFSDIFQSNAVRNGMLPVVLPERVIDAMLAELAASPGGKVAIDLEAQTVTSPGGEVHYFEIDPFSRHCLREGLDEVAYTLSLEDKIAAYEKGLR